MAFLLIVAVTRYVSLGSLVVATILLVWLIIFGRNGAYGVSSGQLPEYYIVAALISGQAFWRHRANIVRLVRGTENKISIGSGKK
ncbi:putative glycerol-3-phosphate acyltransferase PlsY [compost metagenome]